MLAKSFLTLAAAACAAASPIAVSVSAGASASASAGPSCPHVPATPTLPKAGGASELPNPPEGTKLLHIALGFGIQNYTCPTQGANATATGALAMLYDATHLYPGQSQRSLSEEQWAALPGEVLNSRPVPLHFSTSTDGRADPKHPGATNDPWTAETPLIVEGARSLPFIGHHFFNAAGVPTFVLDDGKIMLLAKKIDSHAAPASADPGPDKTGAVAWLYLGNNPGSIGAKYVYRVLTAGGNSHGCAVGAGGDSTSYTATYWFYG